MYISNKKKQLHQEQNENYFNRLSVGVTKRYS